MNDGTSNEPRQMSTSDPQGLEQKIRQRALALYEQRGREDGHDLDDWLQAEKEITGRKARAASA